ncbi:MAG TPA: hypothetical protein H9830_10830 [Candidatus Agrococcus pullicola]|uniref:Lipoprotein n=1 Tax=Candidatus Agrococcus pullicola TaxID=2838429 RepID=A0A9D1YVY0_9MICO|nr:hypothetical protein [Candidatus Agrococcus pullicola]
MRTLSRVAAVALATIIATSATGCQLFTPGGQGSEVGSVAITWSNVESTPDETRAAIHEVMDGKVPEPLLLADGDAWQSWLEQLPGALRSTAVGLDADFPEESVVVGFYRDCESTPHVAHFGDGDLEFAAVQDESVDCATAPETIVVILLTHDELGVDSGSLTLRNAGSIPVASDAVTLDREVGSAFIVWSVENDSANPGEGAAVLEVTPEQREPQLISDKDSWLAWTAALPDPLIVPVTAIELDFNAISMVIGFYDDCAMQPLLFDERDGDLVFAALQDDPTLCYSSYPSIAVMKVDIDELAGDVSELTVRGL